MNPSTLNGVQIVVSENISDLAVVKFDTNPLGFTTPAIDAFNAWLKERFGTKPVFYFCRGQILTNPRGLELLKLSQPRYPQWQD